MTALPQLWGEGIANVTQAAVAVRRLDAFLSADPPAALPLDDDAPVLSRAPAATPASAAKPQPEPEAGGEAGTGPLLEVARLCVSWTHPPDDPSPAAPPPGGPGERPSEGGRVRVAGVEPEAAFAVRDVSLELGRGALLLVAGPVGSGKSSLLAGLLGEARSSGTVRRPPEGVAYCAQLPWIQNLSLRDNVLFGRPHDAARYAQASPPRCAGGTKAVPDRGGGGLPRVTSRA